MSYNGAANFRPPGFKPMDMTRVFDGPDCYRWREVFLWLPKKTISGKMLWLRKAYKQRYWAVWGTGFHMSPEVEYAELFDILKDDYERS